MGTVYRAAGPDGAVALKTIHPHLLDSPGYFKRFLREAEIGRKVESANVVRTLDVDAIGGHHFLVMEYVEGQTLRELLKELERVPEVLCRHIGCEIAKGLGAMHGLGVVHRDLKPENVLITEDQIVKVMDLGVAQLADAAMQLSQTGVFLGSVLYAAPEQFGGGKADFRSDLYSLGLMLYELATGRHPSRARNFAEVMHLRLDSVPRQASDLNPQLSPFFDEVIGMLLSKEAGDRFGSAGELATILEDGERGLWWSNRATLIRARTKRPLRRVRIPRETVLCGRDADLGKLNALYASAAAGDGQVVLIEGEAGIGKTRLVDEFAARIDDDLNFLFGSYPPGGAATEAGAFSTAYREHFGDAGVEEYLSEIPVLAPAFSALLRGEPTPKGEQPLSKDSLQTVFLQSARALAAERPTLLLIDDLHFAPPEGRALFAALAHGIAGHRILLIGTMRRGVPEEWVAGIERAPHASRLELARLGPKDLAKLLVDAFASERLAEELSFRIASKSDGNPFFVFEIIRGLREGQFIRRDRETGKWVTTQVIDRIDVPSSVVDLIHARISSLGEEEREVLDVASCCGFEFDGALVAEALGAERIPTLRRLARIEKQHRLVRAAGRRFVFDHHQMQEALYAGLPEMLREEYHAALGECLSRRELKGSEVVEICEHCFLGGQPERARPHLAGALEQLDRGYLHEAALRLLGRALAAPGLLEGRERIDYLIRHARRLSQLGRRDEQRGVLDEARALADQGDDLLLQARVRAGQAAALGNTSQYEAAEKLALELLELARQVQSKELEATGHEYLANIYWGVGRHDEALEQTGLALALHRADIDDPRGEANLLTQRGVLLEGFGRYDEGRALHEQSVEAARHADDREGVAIATGNLANMAVRRGFLAEALECYQRCLAIFVEVGARRAMTSALVNLGETWIPLGNLKRARDYCERTILLAKEVEYPYVEAYGHLILGEVCLNQGRHDEAEKHLADALSCYRELPAPPQIADTLLMTAELHGWSEQTRPLLDEAAAIAEQYQFAAPEVIARAGLAQLRGADPTSAVIAFEAHQPVLLMRTRLHARHLLWKATGDRVHIEDAWQLLDHLRAHAPEECREAMIAKVPLHRAIWTTS